MSMPMVATPSETTRPRQQNSAIVLIGWVSVLVSEIASVRTFAMAFMATLIIQMDATPLTAASFGIFSFVGKMASKAPRIVSWLAGVKQWPLAGAGCGAMIRTART